MLDNTDYYVQITSGDGPDECAFAVFMVTKLLMQEAKDLKVELKLVDSVEGNKAKTLTSSLISIKGNDINAFKSKWEGSIKWICKSPFRPNHNRKNWFIGVDFFKAIEEDKYNFTDKDIKIDTMRASGPGGQHVNKTDSAVRVTHLPTGLVTIAKEERSQIMNKKLALARLSMLLEQKNTQLAKNAQQEQWQKHRELERGNPIRIFKGMEFREM